MTFTPRPGDYAAVKTISKQWRYRFGAWLIRFGTGSPSNHAVIYVGHVEGYEKPQVIEARPGGAGYADWDGYTHAWWSTCALPAGKNPDPAQRNAIVKAAHGYVGTEYGVLDLVAIALAQRRLGYQIRPANPPWWYKRLASRKTMICSQLVDQCYKDAGIHLETDGRPSGLVSPGDLLRLLHDPQETP